jgi:hypothetical protein
MCFVFNATVFELRREQFYAHEPTHTCFLAPEHFASHSTLLLSLSCQWSKENHINQSRFQLTVIKIDLDGGSLTQNIVY